MLTRAPLSLGLLLSVSLTTWVEAQNRPADRPVDAKNIPTNAPAPFEDPELERYAVYQETAALPESVARVTTELPLELKKGDRIAYVGNTLFDRLNEFGHLEAAIQSGFPGLELSFRNLAWSADEVDLQPRPDNFGTLDQHLRYHEADVVFAAFGFNESFDGLDALPEFAERLRGFLDRVTTQAYNGESAPRVVLFSPTANENVGRVQAAARNNARLAAYAERMAAVAEEMGVGYVDLFSDTEDLFDDPTTDHTFNGVHLLDNGYEAMADIAFESLFDQEAPASIPNALRDMVIEKNRQFRYRYRPVNTFYYTGGRNRAYGYLDFLPAMRNFDIMVANRDQKIWELATGETQSMAIDDSNVPPLPPSKESRGANEWLSPEDELAAFRVDPRFEVNLFASEEQFPDIAAPIQMRWDARGRLWVSCSTTYPHVYPGQKPVDKIVILEDVDGDGRADTSQVFADDLHIPLSFELGDGGVYVSEEPDLTFLKDTDGDGKADFRRRLLTAFGTEDSHHALHDFVWTPDGDLLFRESIFLHSQVETPYGPVRAKNSSWFVFEPEFHRLSAFGAYPNTNPWGVTFDAWGQHVASHPIFATAFHATNPPYPEQHPRPAGVPAYSGVCGQEFVDWSTFPEELQGAFIKVRYKPTNRVEIHNWVAQDDHYAEDYQGDLIFSTNLSFIPVDVRFGPRGALYVLDWYNPVKGHAQYSLRDERRDRKSGRIWRITAKGHDLVEPTPIADQPVAELVSLLERPEYRLRYWVKRELREREPDQVKAALDDWVDTIDPNGENAARLRQEALWLYADLENPQYELLDAALSDPEPRARAAAARLLRKWGAERDDTPDRLARLASDEHMLGRMEAAITASYLPNAANLQAILPILERPMDRHLRYAIRTALGSEALRNLWEQEPSLANERTVIENFMADWQNFAQLRAGSTTRDAVEANFDTQKNLKEVEIETVPARMLFDVTQFAVQAGQPVKLTLVNPDETAHNWVLVQPGSAEEVGIAGNEMAKDPEGEKKHYVPNSDKVIVATKLLKPHTSQTLRFIAPKEPGEYPYLCTFPGHWVIMRGVMVVK